MTAAETTLPNHDRNRLPDRRHNETFLVDHIWSRGTAMEQMETMTVTVGRYAAGGQIGEVFVNCDNHLNQRATALWHDIGVLVSFALQHGASIEDLCAAMARSEVPIMDRLVTVAHSPAGTLLEALLDMEREATR